MIYHVSQNKIQNPYPVQTLHATSPIFTRKKSKMLTCETNLRVRFNEVDAQKIVWHGHYVNYFEDGRQAFGRKYNLGYLDVFGEGFTIPIVEFKVMNKSPLRFNDEAIVKTTFIDTQAAKIKFEYEIFHAESKVLVAKGYSIQVFLSSETNELELYPPSFYIAWKEKWGLR